MQRGRLLLNLSMVSSHDDLDDMVLVRSPEESVVVVKEMSGCLQMVLMVWQCGSSGIASQAMLFCTGARAQGTHVFCAYSIRSCSLLRRISPNRQGLASLVLLK
jgi:hypothetical protein